MANQSAHDKMCVLWGQTAEDTSMNMTLSKDLKVHRMGSDAEMGHTGNASDTNFNANQSQGDREYIRQKYRFEAKDGIETTDSDFQDVIDRMIPVNRNKSFNIPATIKAKELADPFRVQEVAEGFARDIANKIDTVCYDYMINQATQVITSTTDFDWQDGVDAEVLMLNRGLSAYDRKLFLSNKHYAKVAKQLGNYDREYQVREAIERARIPNLSTFQTMRSDYLKSLAANTTSNLTVNGEQSHTVATYDSNGFFLDNRSMSLAVTNATSSTMPVGTKFTIAGVNAVHPETREDTEELQTFTVIETGSGTVKIQPAIVKDGPYQNCSAAAANSAAITVLNKVKSFPSLFYTPESTVIVPGQVPVIDDGIATSTATTENGIPMTMLYWYDGHKMQYNMKAVVSFDVQTIYPEMLGMILDKQA